MATMRDKRLGDHMTVANIEDFKALAPFFRIIEQGLDGLVDGGHFFDLLADDVVTEFVVTVPGYPKRIEGRHNLAELYRGYGDTIVLDRCDDLAVHRDRESSVAVLEYAVHGRVVGTGRPYHNRFVSVITIRDGKVTHWRDYLDPLAVVEALGADIPVRD
jgi:ketosteroid isomerase-like protein